MDANELDLKNFSTAVIIRMLEIERKLNALDKEEVTMEVLNKKHECLKELLALKEEVQRVKDSLDE